MLQRRRVTLVRGKILGEATECRRYFLIDSLKYEDSTAACGFSSLTHVYLKNGT